MIDVRYRCYQTVQGLPYVRRNKKNHKRNNWPLFNSTYFYLIYSICIKHYVQCMNKYSIIITVYLSHKVHNYQLKNPHRNIPIVIRIRALMFTNHFHLPFSVILVKSRLCSAISASVAVTGFGGSYPQTMYKACRHLVIFTGVRKTK